MALPLPYQQKGAGDPLLTFSSNNRVPSMAIHPLGLLEGVGSLLWKEAPIPRLPQATCAGPRASAGAAHGKTDAPRGVRSGGRVGDQNPPSSWSAPERPAEGQVQIRPGRPPRSRVHPN